MILDPINSITSIAFYKKVAKQSVLRTIAYLNFAIFLYALMATLAVKVTLMPEVNAFFTWLEKTAPPITFSAGKISTPNPEPVTLRYPKVPEMAATIDTARTEPVTIQNMEEAKVTAYLTGSAFDVMERPGEIKMYDLSKGNSPKPIVIDGKFYQNAAQFMGWILYPAVLIGSYLFLLFLGTATSFAFSTMALIINTMLGAGLRYGPLFNMTVHAQTLSLFLLAICLFLPQGLSLVLTSFPMITAAYLWLAIKANTDEAPLPAP